jgi:hypothetical protein
MAEKMSVVEFDRALYEKRGFDYDALSYNTVLSDVGLAVAASAGQFVEFILPTERTLGKEIKAKQKTALANEVIPDCLINADRLKNLVWGVADRDDNTATIETNFALYNARDFNSQVLMHFATIGAQLANFCLGTYNVEIERKNAGLLLLKHQVMNEGTDESLVAKASADAVREAYLEVCIEYDNYGKLVCDDGAIRLFYIARKIGGFLGFDEAGIESKKFERMEFLLAD